MYTVIYYLKNSNTWMKSPLTSKDYESAVKKASQLESNGIFTLIHKTGELAKLGMPEGPPRQVRPRRGH